MRQDRRDSLFLQARMRIEDVAEECRVRVRNLSAGGLMAVGELIARSGTPVSIEIRGVGWVEGTIAWIGKDRFGVAFKHTIDPGAARAPTTATGETDLLVRRVPRRDIARNEPQGPLRRV